MAETNDAMDRTLRNEDFDVPTPGTTSQALRNMWEAVEQAVEAIVRKNTEYDQEKVAEFAARKASEIAKAAAHLKAKEIVEQMKKLENGPKEQNAEGRKERVSPTKEQHCTALLSRDTIVEPKVTDHDRKPMHERTKSHENSTENARAGEACYKPSGRSNDSVVTEVAHPWKKIKTLGKGAYGVVYLGEDKAGLRFAAKEVFKSEELEKSLKDEIEFLSRLSHENIVKFFGCYSTEHNLYMFMELMTGSIKDKMDKEDQPISQKTARKYTKQLLLGLIFLHENGIVHRDIKCANVLLDDNDLAKLADMGVAKVHVNVTKTANAQRAGSFHWMSPEVMGGKEGGKRSDVWSVGCTVYEMVTHKPPFAEIQGWIVLSQLYEKACRMEHRTLVLSHQEIDSELKNFLTAIFVTKNDRPYASDLSRHHWVR